MSARENFGRTPSISSRSPDWRFKSRSTVGEVCNIARLVAIRETPQPPLLENTAIARPRFAGASETCSTANWLVRSMTVESSSSLIGKRIKSRAPARMLLRIRSGDESREEQITAVLLKSLTRRWTSFTPGSPRWSKLMMTAEGRSRAVSVYTCSGSSLATSTLVPAWLFNARPISLRSAAFLQSTMNVRFRFITILLSLLSLLRNTPGLWRLIHGRVDVCNRQSRTFRRQRC